MREKEEHYLDGIKLTQEEYGKVFLTLKDARENALRDAVTNFMDFSHDAANVFGIVTETMNDIAEENDEYDWGENWEIEEDEEE